MLRLNYISRIIKMLQLNKILRHMGKKRALKSFFSLEIFFIMIFFIMILYNKNGLYKCHSWMNVCGLRTCGLSQRMRKGTSAVII